MSKIDYLKKAHEELRALQLEHAAKEQQHREESEARRHAINIKMAELSAIISAL